MCEAIPAEVQSGLDHYRVAPALAALVAEVAEMRPVTAGEPAGGYMGLRATWKGTIAGHFHATYVDVALTPQRARQVAADRRWCVVRTNASTGYLRIPADDLAEARARELAAELLHEALDKSGAGLGHHGSGVGPATSQGEPELCGRHHVAMLGGECDRCG